MTVALDERDREMEMSQEPINEHDWESFDPADHHEEPTSYWNSEQVGGVRADDADRPNSF